MTDMEARPDRADDYLSDDSKHCSFDASKIIPGHDFQIADCYQKCSERQQDLTLLDSYEHESLNGCEVQLSSAIASCGVCDEKTQPILLDSTVCVAHSDKEQCEGDEPVCCDNTADNDSVQFANRIRVEAEVHKEEGICGDEITSHTGSEKTSSEKDCCNRKESGHVLSEDVYEGCTLERCHKSCEVVDVNENSEEQQTTEYHEQRDHADSTGLAHVDWGSVSVDLPTQNCAGHLVDIGSNSSPDLYANDVCSKEESIRLSTCWTEDASCASAQENTNALSPTEDHPSPSIAQRDKAHRNEGAKEADKLRPRKQPAPKAQWKAVFTTPSMVFSRSSMQARQKRLSRAVSGTKIDRGQAGAPSRASLGKRTSTRRAKTSSSGSRLSKDTGVVDASAANGDEAKGYQSSSNAESAADRSHSTTEGDRKSPARLAFTQYQQAATKRAVQSSAVKTTKHCLRVAVVDSTNPLNAFSKRTTTDLALMNDLRERRYALKSYAYYSAREGMLHIAVRGLTSELPPALLHPDGDGSACVRLELVKERPDKATATGKSLVPQPVLQARRPVTTQSPSEPPPADRDVLKRRAITPAFDTNVCAPVANQINLAFPLRTRST